MERQQPCRFQEELIIMQIFRDSFLLFIHSSAETHCIFIISLPTKSLLSLSLSVPNGLPNLQQVKMQELYIYNMY